VRIAAYFITGATGVVGSEIAARLLGDGGSRLLLLIRATDDAHGAARLAELGAYWGVPPEILRDRVEVVRGDTALPGFGLAEPGLRKIAQTVTHIVHCAALVRMNLPLGEARRSAVQGAENVIELAHACHRSGQLRKVEFLSTVGIAGRRSGVLPERWITEPRTFHNTYEQAKAEAERVAAQACDAGLPLTVFRPSMVVGDSVTGRIIRFQVFYHLLEFLSGRRTSGLYPFLGNARLDLVPVDYISRVVVWSSQTPATVGRILHLCAGPQEAIPLADLRDRVRTKLRALGLTLPPGVPLPTPLFRAALPILRAILPGPQQRALAALPVFLDYLEDRQEFGNVETTDLLAKEGISRPALPEFLDSIVDYYLARRGART
jgi:thioester reductase-like protein